jgi:uncharacterized protein (TIGR00251 family)
MLRLKLEEHVFTINVMQTDSPGDSVCEGVVQIAAQPLGDSSACEITCLMSLLKAAGQEKDRYARLSLKVVPGASHSEIAGWLGDDLKVRVAVQPEKGKANNAVIKLLAKALAITPDSVSIVNGETSAHKIVAISGMTLAQVKTLLLKETSK